MIKMGKKNQMRFEEIIDDEYDSTTSLGPSPPPSMSPPPNYTYGMYGNLQPLKKQDIELKMPPPQPDGENKSVEIPTTKVIREFSSNEEPMLIKSSGKCLWNTVYILLICITVMLGVGFATGAFLSRPTTTTSQQAIINNLNSTNDEKNGEGEQNNSSKVEILRPQGNNNLSTNLTNKIEATIKPMVMTTKPTVVTTGPTIVAIKPTIVTTQKPVITLPPQKNEGVELKDYTSNMKEFLSLISVNGEATFLDPNAAESLAQHFLASEDALRLDPAKTDQQWRIKQRYALITLWYESNGNSWTVFDGWMLDNDECNWYGIECNRNGEIETINLENNNLYGGISEDFALLGVSLTSINLADNYLEGNIPASFQRLSKLQNLYLDRNLLGGMLNELDFTRLQSLTLIDLSNNNLYGPIPESIFGLELLQFLILDNNQLEKGISASIAKLSNTLQRLTLSNNQLTGNIVTEVGSLVNLQVLWLFNNNFTGPLLEGEEFLNMQNLIALDVSMNKISGEIPNKFVDMPNLKILNLGKNRLTGTIPSQLSPNLTFLNIEDNFLTGNIPIGIQNCINLSTLRLGNNSFRLRSNLAIPQFLFNMGNSLTDLRLNGIGYAGQFDINMKSLTNLKTLHLQDNKFVNRFPIRILTAIGVNLKYLDMSNNDLGGAIPDYINEILPQVEHLDISYNNFYGNLPEKLADLEKLSYLDASSNSFGGKFPPFGESNNSSKLEYLNLNTNKLVGTVPSLIGKALLDLKTLDVSNNRLTGTIPPEITALYKLEILLLSLNSMSGTIPEGTLPGPALNNLIKLRILELYGNQFTGNLPSELPASMELIDFAHNPGINGTIPMSFSALTDLNELYLYDTGISGSVPEGLCANPPKYFVTDCTIACECCTDCFKERK